MNKTELINKFLEKADLKPHELVYWKHKVSNGFDLIKFMSDFLDYAESEQLLIQRVSNCGGGIPYDSLSDSFKKSIDSIEDNLNK